MNLENYKKAYTEVLEILSYLEEEEYNKIPKSFINEFEEYRDKEYKYELNEELELNQQKMLRETKTILFCIFRDYLATPKQRESIKRMQQEERERNESKKILQHKKDIKFEPVKFETSMDITENMQLSTQIQEQNILEKILNKIKKLIRK